MGQRFMYLKIESLEKNHKKTFVITPSKAFPSTAQKSRCLKRKVN
jgi:hypothetical protein